MTDRGRPEGQSQTRWDAWERTGRRGRLAIAVVATIGAMLPGCGAGTVAPEQARPKDQAVATGKVESEGAPEPPDEQSVQSILGLPDKQAPATSVESLATKKEPAPRPLHPSLNAYVAPSPHSQNRAKVGNESSDIPVPSTKHGLSAASDTVGGTVAWQELSQAIRSIESDGHQVGISVADMSGNEILSYAPDAEMYPASAIKGPYVLAVWEGRESHPSSLVGWTDNILGWSDNDSYHAMRDAYGDAPMYELADECSLDLSYYGGSVGSWAQWYYPRTSPSDMTRMWSHFVPYLLDMGDDGAGQLRDMMAEREVSPIRDALPLSATTYGKAGWLSEYGDYGSTPAAVDAGIVLWPDGRGYVVTIMTDTEEDMETVSELAACIDRVHYAMVHPQ